MALGLHLPFDYSVTPQRRGGAAALTASLHAHEVLQNLERQHRDIVA